MNDEQKFEFDIVPYSPQYRQQTLALMNSLWQKSNDEEASEYFSWRYDRCPYSSAPIIVLAIHSEVVIGVLGHMVQRFVINNKPENACIPVDGFVLKEYRLHGVYARLLKESATFVDSLKDEYNFQVYFNASSNVRSAIGLINLGWKLIGPKMYMSKISLLNMIIGNPKLSDKDGVAEFKKHGNVFIFETTNTLKSGEIESLNAIRKDYVGVVHDSKYINWRYSYKRDSYRFAYLYKDSKLVCYIVYVRGSKVQYAIEEYGYTDSYSLFLALTQLVKQVGIKVLRLFYLVLNTEERSAFRKAGFVIEHLWMLRLLKIYRSSVYFRSLSGGEAPHDYIINGLDTRNIANWRLYHSDIL